MVFTLKVISMAGHQGLRYLKNLNDLNDLDLNDLNDRIYTVAATF